MSLMAPKNRKEEHSRTRAVICPRCSVTLMSADQYHRCGEQYIVAKRRRR